MFRKQLLDQLDRVQDRAEPTINMFRDPATNQCIEVPQESFRGVSEEGGGNRRETPGRRRPYVPQEAGARDFADRYSNPASLTRAADEVEAVMETWSSIPVETRRRMVAEATD